MQLKRFVPVTMMCLLLGSAIAVGEPVDYLSQVKPVLARRCYSCHGGLKQESGLRLDTVRRLRQGGDSGPAVVAGDPGASLLIERIAADEASSRMPPEGKPLAAEEIALIKRWIQEGADGPSDERPEADPRKHWAFVPPVRPAPPGINDVGWVRNPIDAFVAAQHKQRGLTPAAPAEKNILLRRVYLDLIGLPPTREQLSAYLADRSATAYENVVEQLLASPQYGERWGRHWMDVWRYSDWYGRRSVNDVRNSYPQIWRWRDWIVTSLNRDVGYDTMVRHMLAADELVPDDDEEIVATGYIVRNWFSLNYHQWMKDLVEHTGKAFLGLRLNCAHCHDHKYDPITQEEYFRFRAFFEPLELRRDRWPGEPDPGPFQKYVYASSTKPITSGMIRVFDEKLDAETYMYRLGDTRDRFAESPPVAPGAPSFLGGDRLAIEAVDLPAVAYYPGVKDFIRRDERAKHKTAVSEATTTVVQARAALESILTTVARSTAATPDERRSSSVETAEQPDETTTETPAASDARLELRLAESQLASATADLAALEARIRADEIRYQSAAGNSRIAATAASKAEGVAKLRAAEAARLQADKALRAAKAAAAGTKKKAAAAAVSKAEKAYAAADAAVKEAQKALEAEDEKYTPLSPTYPTKSSGRRSALARWMTDANNPLTARVAVNHIWMRHFGRLLVESVFDFGRSGTPPTHPALLDWLAVELVESGWSMKHLHRLIVTSNTYRMHSKGTGKFNEAIDGANRYLWRCEPRRMESEVVRDSILYLAGELDRRQGGPELDNKTAEQTARRSLYYSVFPEAGGHAKMLSYFDAPNPGDCYRRTESIVPQQALVMTNSALAINQSRRLSKRLLHESPDESFIAAAFEQVLSRRPTQAEASFCLRFLGEQQRLFHAQVQSPTSAAKQSGYIKPSSDPKQRARASLIRVLFSHNDFVTIR